MCDAIYDIEDFKNDLREACAKLKSLQGICENALGHIEDLEEHRYSRWAEARPYSKQFQRSSSVLLQKNLHSFRGTKLLLSDLKRARQHLSRKQGCGKKLRRDSCRKR